MPNPYDEIFENKNEENKHSQSKQPKFTPLEFEGEDNLKANEKEPLEEILRKIQLFQKEAEAFSQLLSSTRAVDYKVTNKVVRLFIVESDPHDKKNLKGERKYYDFLQRKFETIIVPMRSLAKNHLDIVKTFNRDIDKDYYSIEKTDRDIKSDISFAINGLNMQRKILADAAGDLSLLKDALIDTERRIKAYIDAGGMSNLSRAEFEIMNQKRSTLTSGRDHKFDYSFFNINFLDKTVISLGLYMKETTSQYLGKLAKVFEIG